MTRRPRATFALVNTVQLMFNSWCIWELRLIGKKKGEKKGKINKEQNRPCYHAPSVLD